MRPYGFSVSYRSFPTIPRTPFGIHYSFATLTFLLIISIVYRNKAGLKQSANESQEDSHSHHQRRKAHSIYEDPRNHRMGRHAMANRFEEEKNIQSDHHHGQSTLPEKAGHNESSDEQDYHRQTGAGDAPGAIGAREDMEHEGYGEEMEEDEMDEE